MRKRKHELVNSLIKAMHNLKICYNFLIPHDSLLVVNFIAECYYHYFKNSFTSNQYVRKNDTDKVLIKFTWVKNFFLK